MSLADDIRVFAYKKFICPARASKSSTVKIRAGDVHADMGLNSRMPAVCSALGGRKFADQYDLELRQRGGPPQGANAEFTFYLGASRSDNANQERGNRARKQPKSEPKPKPKPKPKPRHRTRKLHIETSDTIYLVSCVKTKRDEPARAKDLYISPWFVKARAYVEARGVPWFILSAEHGLVRPNDVIAPYESTLKKMSASDRRQWATKVARQLAKRAPRAKSVTFLAGQAYREFLLAVLESKDIQVNIPMEGLALGEQLSWLDAHAIQREPEYLPRFYSLLERLEDILGEKRALRDCTAKSGWPQHGVYFFFDDQEPRAASGSGPRVVRVGTHALQANADSTLWGRLSQHKGTIKTGGGNHRGSIFRLLVGNALKRKSGSDEPISWGIGRDAGKAAKEFGVTSAQIREQEESLERAVSKYIGNLPFLWLDIGDPPGPDSLRGDIERNAIALLSDSSSIEQDPASRQWLGQYCDRARVRSSGLWNNNHVGEKVDASFLDRMEQSIEGRNRNR